MKLTIEEMQEISEKRGGRCLSTKYIDSSTKLLWECHKGHKWRATPTKIKHQGTWCPKCSGNKKLTITEMKAIAKGRGGRCLSHQYMNNNTKLLWECSEKHKWAATPGNIKAGKWCPKCAGRIKPTITEMEEVAKERGGKCLSNRYVDSNSKLLWECAEGHRWEAIFYNIISGKWCPKCAVNKNAEKLRADIAEFKNIAEERGGRCISHKYIS